MQIEAVAAVLCALAVPAACQQLNIAVCDLAGSRHQVLADAEREAGYVFYSAGVQVSWSACRQYPDWSVRRRQPWFVVRLRAGEAPTRESLDVLGRALVVRRGEGFLADIYLQPVSRLAAVYNHGETGEVLGLVIAHEVGHLLLGPGHSPMGVMLPVWGKAELAALSQRWLKFDAPDSAALRDALHARTINLRAAVRQ